MKTIAVILLVSLILPHTLFAAPSIESQPSSSNTYQQSPPLPKGEPDSGYSSRAKNVYLGTGIGTLVAGGAFVVMGANESNSDHITSKSAGTALYVIGGSFLAASTILWILYFREKGKEPTTSVGLDVEKGKAVAQVNYRF